MVNGGAFGISATGGIDGYGWHLVLGDLYSAHGGPLRVDRSPACGVESTGQRKRSTRQRKQNDIPRGFAIKAITPKPQRLAI